MKKLLLALILSFLVFINVRLWGMREATFLLHEPSEGRSTCDMPYCQKDVTNADIQSQNCQSCEGQTRFAKLKSCLARAASYMKYKEKMAAQKTAAQKVDPLPVEVDSSDYLPQYQTVQQMLNNSLAEFTSCPSCNELTLQQLVDLMNAELRLLEVLIYPTIGNRYDLIQARSDLLDQAIPSVRLVYDKILSMATHNEQLNDRYAIQKKYSQNVQLALNSNHKKIFLHTMYQRLSDVKQRVQNMQYKLALNQANYRI